jgi:hypothetical protein
MVRMDNDPNGGQLKDGIKVLTRMDRHRSAASALRSGVHLDTNRSRRVFVIPSFA